MTSLQPQIKTQYNLGPVKSWVENAAYVIGPQFDIKTIYGWRQSDPFPDHPSGHALDFMTPSMSAGNALSQYAVTNNQALGVKYVIWNRQYWSASTGWKPQPYTATSNPHTDHVHVTFLDSPGSWTSSPGISPSTFLASAIAGKDETCAWKLSANLSPLPGDTGYCVLSKTQARALLGGLVIVGGAFTTLVGVVLLMVYGLNQTKAASLLPSKISRLL